MNARHTPSLESLLERHREGGAFPTYAELSALAAPAAPSEQAEPIQGSAALIKDLRTVAAMMSLGERIAWGRDTSLMQQAAAMIESLFAAAAPAAPLPDQPEQSAPTDGLISVDAFYQDAAEDIAHALAHELEDAELSPNDFVTVNREKLLAIANRVLVKAAATSASPSLAPAPTEVQQTLPLCNSALRAEPAGQRDAGASGWQPIETAPKDGTSILLYTAAGMIEACWSYGNWEQSPCYATYDGCGGVALSCEPIYWMPLPAAPDFSPASRMGGITSKESVETAAPAQGCDSCLHTYCLSNEVCRDCGHVAELQGLKGGKRPGANTEDGQ